MSARRAEQLDPGLGEEFSTSQRQTPGSQRRLLTHAIKAYLCRLNTLSESRMNRFQIVRNRRFETGLRSIKLFELRKFGQVARNARHVKGQLTERH